METFYLVDYENVGGEGLRGCNKLNKTDHIIIFFTKNAKKIDMSEIANHGEATLEMIEVPAGRQSADHHIGSYLGYLVGNKEEKECRIVIISKDTDFDNVIKFWRTRRGTKASRTEKIKELTEKLNTGKQSTNTKQATDIKNTKGKVSGAKKSKLNQEVMQAIREAGFSAAAGNAVAQLVTGVYGEENMMSEIHNGLKAMYTNYLEVYQVVKPVASKYAKSTVEPAKAPIRSKSDINSSIMQLCRKAGFEAGIANFVASTVVKSVGVKNRKNEVYRKIVLKYGQKKGLNIYNHIKKHI